MEKIDELSQSKYCYQGTSVLINKKNILDKEQLKAEEVELTTYKLSLLNLDDDVLDKKYNFDHYLSIHRFLFDELYDFAGCIRNENVYKCREPYATGKTPFCQVYLIRDMLNQTLQEMNINYRKITNRERYVLFLSKYFLDLNIVHPFREGNGRTLREFLREYVERINKDLGFDFELDYTMDEETKDKFAAAAVLDDQNLAYEVFDLLLKEPKKEKLK